MMIRIFQDDDIDQAAQIWLDASLVAHHFIAAEFWHENLGRMKEIYLPGANGYVYQVDGKIRGFIVLEDNFIHLMFIDPTAQRQGIGTALLRFVKQQHDYLALTVYMENHAAVSFYKRCSFVVTDEKIDEHTGCVEYVMTWHSCHPGVRVPDEKNE